MKNMKLLHIFKIFNFQYLLILVFFFMVQLSIYVLLLNMLSNVVKFAREQHSIFPEVEVFGCSIATS